MYCISFQGKIKVLKMQTRIACDECRHAIVICILPAIEDREQELKDSYRYCKRAGS